MLLTLWPWPSVIYRQNKPASGSDFQTKPPGRNFVPQLMPPGWPSLVAAQLRICPAHRNEPMKTFVLPIVFLACVASDVFTAPADAGASAADERSASPVYAKLSYRRVFKSSSPEFIEIIVRDDSDAATFEIRQLDEDPGSSPFEVGEPLRAKMFELAGELKNFQGQDLDVHRRIANLGEK